MAIHQQTSKQYFKGLYILQVAFMTGLFLFSLITLHLRMAGGFDSGDSGLDDIFSILVPVLFILGLIGGIFMFKKRMEALRRMPDLKDKMNGYRGAFIMRTAFMEGPALLAIIAFLLTGNYLLLAVAAMGIVIFLLWLPSKEKVSNQLELSTQEKSIVDEPDAVIADIQTK